MTSINGFILMCSGSLAITAFMVVLGANFARLVSYAIGGDRGD